MIRPPRPPMRFESATGVKKVKIMSRTKMQLSAWFTQKSALIPHELRKATCTKGIEVVRVREAGDRHINLEHANTMPLNAPCGFAILSPQMA